MQECHALFHQKKKRKKLELLLSETLFIRIYNSKKKRKLKMNKLLKVINSVIKINMVLVDSNIFKIILYEKFQK